MDDVCSPLFQRKNKFDFNQKENIDTNKKWFDEECKTARDLFFNNLNMYRKCKTDFNRINMCKARSEYKHIIRKKRFESRKDNTSKLLKARVSNAKELWKLLIGVSVNSSPKTVSADTFAKFFKAINNPDSNYRLIPRQKLSLFFRTRFISGIVE